MQLQKLVNENEGKIVTKKGKKSPNGMTRIMQLVQNNKVISSVEFWPWSQPSIENASKYLVEAAYNKNIKINWDES